jgi:predicted thioesterase
MRVQPGLTGTAETPVVFENTAAAMGSGALEVFATPAMIALMENASLELVQPYLQEGEGTVGISISVSHDAPTPIGRCVVAESELIEVDRKKLVFRVEARVGEEVIGKGTHTRFIVNSDRFLQKAMAK